MGEKSIRRVRRSESDWRTLMEQFDRSGVSRLAFCTEAGIPPSTFQLWERKLRLNRMPAEFVEVKSVSQPSSRWSIEIAFPDGTTARVRG